MANIRREWDRRIPIVSIVIPTYNRQLDLIQTLEHIYEYCTYDKESLDIIIVGDGPQKLDNYGLQDRFDCTIVELGRNWSGEDSTSFGIAPLIVGYLMASGHYIMPWCDDERALVPNHIEKLVKAIETPLQTYNDNFLYPDFVYPLVHIWRNGDPNGKESAIIGTVPPVHGQITHYLFRPQNFVKYGWPRWNTHPVDWSLVSDWMSKGALYRMVPEVTFDHRLDQ